MDKNRILIELSESERTQFGRVDFAVQPEEQKVFSAVWALESEVDNGGFLQYVANESGETAEFAAEALRIIGASKCADLVERAMRTIAPSGLPESPDEREELVEALSGKARRRIDEIEQRFLEYPDDLTGLLFAYVAAHPKVFGPV